MMRVRYSIVQKTALTSQRMMFTTALKQYQRMRTAHRMKRKARMLITANVVVVLLYTIIFNFYVDSGAVK